MAKKQEKLDFWIDDLTNSIRNRISGDSFQTEVSRLTKSNLKLKDMGYLKEPKGVDFIIESEPLTEKDRKEISRFIAEYKSKSKKRKQRKRETANNKH